ncbi:MAG: diadenylate cyclase CdaA [Clostridia bacterium]|nr:diadenylate cyclase CdaA [Clostridia bacterium]
MGSIGEVFSFLWSQIKSITWTDVIDILLVAVLLYYAITFFRDRRAGKLAGGVVLLALALIVSNLLQMRVISFILESIVSVGVLALIIIFQPELRSILEKMGRGSFFGLGKLVESKSGEDTKNLLKEVCTAVSELAETKTGALIVLERKTGLGDEIRTGTVLNADVTAPLIRNVFFNKAPLHDGAMILRDGRIFACGCFLPLSSNPEVDRRLGTRHRAALGVSEISDAAVIVVSEETGTISLARDGKLKRGFDRYTLENELLALLRRDEDQSKDGGLLGRVKSIWKKNPKPSEDASEEVEK